MLLSDVQKQAVRILENAKELRFAGLSVHKVDQSDAAQVYADALAQSGTSVGVLPATARFKPDSDGPVSEEGGITLRVNVSEPIELSRAQGVPPVTEIAETVATLLHTQNYPGRADDVPLGVEDILIIPDKELFILQVVCRATGQLSLVTK